ncbi:Spy/CpxP family protein refolding chaperone [Paraglaciecola polaris]|uniref:Periplasmic protein CpxP n=1 Tax=Paraglaciecola polaris LMG 21857 TaxID=1129793 RepID=K6YE61_9ALTE|nr:Spy/CpxP family protein refolding chaperone [Paraglaciecola polaris]GAC31029.1 periplasmic protein CpxP [Paraglaciecola polaris LMG 21857]|tara:strand:+ start:448 stop:876 length:429 start_codon:yes stop_codon:yes gene_type:complete
MRKLITGVLLSACIAGSAFAGGQHSGGHKGQSFFPVHKMVKVLDLSDEQAAQIKALKAEMKANRPEKDNATSIRAQLAQLDSSDANYEQALNELADLRAQRAKEQFLNAADMRLKISQILTPEQLEKFNAMAEKRAKRHNKA